MLDSETSVALHITKPPTAPLRFPEECISEESDRLNRMRNRDIWVLGKHVNTIDGEQKFPQAEFAVWQAARHSVDQAYRPDGHCPNRPFRSPDFQGSIGSGLSSGMLSGAVEWASGIPGMVIGPVGLTFCEGGVGRTPLPI